MIAVISLMALALLIGLVVRGGRRDLEHLRREARRDALLRAAEREQARLHREWEQRG